MVSISAPVVHTVPEVTSSLLLCCFPPGGLMVIEKMKETAGLGGVRYDELTAGLLNVTLDRLASTQLGLSGAQEGVSAGFSVSSECSN